MTLRPLLFTSLLFAFAAQAQDSTVMGVVSDGASGQPVSEVVITATSPSLQGESLVTSDAEGQYGLSGLPAGRYTLKFEHDDFETFTRSDLRLPMGGTLRLNAALPLRRDFSAALPTIAADDTSAALSLSAGFVRSCGAVRALAPTPPLRPFESLAHLAPHASEDLYAVSVGGGSADVAYVIDGVAELPEWTHAYPPVVRPSGEAQRLHVYTEELP